MAEITGVDRRTIKSRLTEIDPVKKEGRASLYDTHKTLALALGMGSGTDSNIDKELKEAQLRRELAAADKIEIDNARTRGELISQEDATRIMGKELTYVRAAILSVPSKLAKPIAMEDDPNITHLMLQREVDEILNHIQADMNLQIEPEEVDEKYFPEEDDKTEE